MSQKRIIGLDCDGVVIDHTANKIKAARLLGLEVALEDTPSDLMSNRVDSLSWKTIKRMIYDDPQFLFSAPIMPGAEEALKLFQATGQDYFLISRQKNPVLALESLKVHGLWDRYLNASNTFFVEDSLAKNQKVQELGINIYLDDQPSVLVEIDVPTRLLFDPFWVYPKEPWYERVKTWPEFVDIIRFGY